MNVTSPPSQTGLLLETSTVGLAFTTTVIVLLASHPFAATTDAEYIPALSEVAFEILIAAVDAVYPLGPAHV